MTQKNKETSVVIVSKEEAFWREVLEKSENTISLLEKELKLNEAIKKMIKNKIEEAKKNEKKHAKAK